MTTLWEGPVTGDMAAPEDATSGIVDILRTRQVTWLIKPHHADTTGFGYRVWLLPLKGTGTAAPPPKWYTDSNSASGMQGTETFPSPNTTGGRILSIEVPPCAKAYLQLHTLTGTTKSLYAAFVRGQ